MTTLSEWRINYPDHPLEPNAFDACPIKQFQYWLHHAYNNNVIEPNAASFATVDADGLPDNRMLLVKEINKQGFIFYTNYNSNKAIQLQYCLYAALTFWWPNVHRQVRIKGYVEKIATKASQNYFSQRDRDTQIGTWVSNQSEVIPDYDYLRHQFNKQKQMFSDRDVIPKPENWGGYIVKPLAIEFWQGRANRLHDRLVYHRNHIDDKKWQFDRLSP